MPSDPLRKGRAGRRGSPEPAAAGRVRGHPLGDATAVTEKPHFPAAPLSPEGALLPPPPPLPPRLSPVRHGPAPPGDGWSGAGRGGEGVVEVSRSLRETEGKRKRAGR